LGSAHCNTLGNDLCYTTATNVSNLSTYFSVVLTNLSAITFTVNAGIIDRNYLVGTWRVVHRIKKSTTIIGFNFWEISFDEVKPIWSTDALSQSAFFIYAAADVTVTLPAQTEAVFNTATTFTNIINVISTPTYTGSVECSANGADSCFTAATEVSNLSTNFAAVLTNLSAITFTVKAGIIDRSYLIGTWKIVHRIKQGTNVLGFQAWEISFDELVPVWSIAALSQSTFFIYAAAAVPVTLPAQTLT